MIPPAVEIVQDGNHLLVIAGFAPVDAARGIAAKSLDFGPALGSGVLPVEYSAIKLGRVDDSEWEPVEGRLWVQAQLDKRHRYVAMIRDLIERKALTLTPGMAAFLQGQECPRTSQPIVSLGLIHRGIHHAVAGDTLAYMQSVRAVMSPAGLREIERAALLEERERFYRQQGRST